jgi:hypothetical protein
MSFDTIKIERSLQNTELTYTEYVVNELPDSKDSLLSGLNREGSVEYYFEGDLLKRKIRDGQRMLKSLNKLGYNDEDTKSHIAVIEDKPVYFDFGAIRERYEAYMRRFASTTKYDFSNIRINITFDPFVNAGARKLKDCNLISVYHGANYIHQWLAERKVIDYFFVQTNSKGRATQFKFPNDTLTTLSSIVNGLRARAKLIFGYLDKLNMEDLKFAIAANDIIHNKTDMHEQIFEKRTNIYSAEKFILFHELGHIFHGHLEESEHWQNFPAASDAELRKRLDRRRQMEFEADKFGFDFLMIQTALENNWPLKDFHRHKNAYFNYFNPVADIFTMFQMAQNDLVNFDDAYCPYPSNKQRMVNLLGGEDHTFIFDLLTNFPQ